MKSIIVFFLFSFCFISESYAGVVIGGTRFIYNEGGKNTNVHLENPDKVPYLIQSWIDDIDEKNNQDSQLRHLYLD